MNGSPFFGYCGTTVASQLPIAPYQLPPVDRKWVPTGNQAPPSSIIRHPNLFDDVLPDVDQTFPIRRSRSASRGWQAKLPSKKLQRTVRARSHLEQRAFERCEVDGNIIRYCEQPISFQYVDSNGTLRTHTPDLYYETSNYQSFVEIKWESDARSERNETRWPYIGLSVAALGFCYEVLTERHILRRPLADNVSELLRFRRFEPVSATYRDCITGILRKKPLSLGDVVSLLPGVEMAGLYRGLVDGWLSTNLEVPLSAQSILRLSEARRQNQ